MAPRGRLSKLPHVVVPQRLARDAMKFEFNRHGKLIVLEVKAVRNSTTHMGEGVIAVELVAARF